MNSVSAKRKRSVQRLPFARIACSVIITRLQCEQTIISNFPSSTTVDEVHSLMPMPLLRLEHCIHNGHVARAARELCTGSRVRFFCSRARVHPERNRKQFSADKKRYHRWVSQCCLQYILHTCMKCTCSRITLACTCNFFNVFYALAIREQNRAIVWYNAQRAPCARKRIVVVCIELCIVCINIKCICTK